MAPNCASVGENPRTVSVTAGSVIRDTPQATFEVTCVSKTGSIEIGATSSGAQLDPDGYTVFVSDCYFWSCTYYQGYPLGVNDVVTVAVPAG